MGALRRNLFLVCHNLRSPDNLGAIARLMANFGLEQVVLAEPITSDFQGAARLAVGAEHVLQSLKLAHSLDEAVAPAVYTLGTSSRTSSRQRTSLSPEEGVSRLSAAATTGPVALVLGGEKRGLSDDELARCDDFVTIPTEAAQPSMNLSQAAAVLLYLVASVDVRPGSAEPPPVSGEPGATHALRSELEAELGEVLTKTGFLNPQAPQHVRRELVRSLGGGRPSQRVIAMWLSAVRHIARALS